MVGLCEVEVRYEEYNPVKGNGPNLVGRDWLKEVELNWPEICRIREADQELESL